MRDNQPFRAWTIRVGLTIIIVALLILLNLSVTFVDSIHEFFSGIAAVPITGILINVACIWLLISLWAVFRRWRSSYTEQLQLEAIISSISPDVLIVVAPDRTVTRCNTSVERVFGYKPDELVGQ